VRFSLSFFMANCGALIHNNIIDITNRDGCLVGQVFNNISRNISFSKNRVNSKVYQQQNILSSSYYCAVLRMRYGHESNIIYYAAPMVQKYNNNDNTKV